MGEAYYVHATLGQTGSQLVFSALYNAMIERKAVGIVRFVGKSINTQKYGTRWPNPRLGVLYPDRTEPGLEYFYFVPVSGKDARRCLE